MPDISILQSAAATVPTGYTIAGSQEIVLKGVTASFDGTSAAGSFIPAVQIVDPSGHVVGTYTAGTTLLAGATADISWFPGVGTSTSAAPPSSGIFWPAGNQGAASYDTTTYNDPVAGAGKLDTLMFPAGASGSAAFAMAETGDTHPRVLIPSTMDVTFTGGILLGDGTIDPYNDGNGGIGITPAGVGNVDTVIWGQGTNVAETGLDTNSGLTAWNVSYSLEIEKAPGHTGGVPGYVSHYAGNGVPGTLGGNKGDKYWRQDGGAGTYLYHCSVAGGTGAATWIAIL